MKYTITDPCKKTKKLTPKMADTFSNLIILRIYDAF
jgi:hypothetical protein